MAGSEILGYDVDGPKVVITLNRPESMNALSVQLRTELDAAVTEFNQDDNLLVAILTGAGGRAFSAGADLKEMAEAKAPRTQNSPDAKPWAPDMSPGRRAIEGFTGLDRSTKPVVAAIDGYCLAGGFELSLYCDIRIATRQSKFGLPEPRRSLLAGPGLINLARMIPLGEAMRIQLTGGHLPAERAYQIGLVQDLAEDREELFRKAHWYADQILECAPLAVQFIKRIVKDGRDLPVDAQWRLSDMFTRAIGQTEDQLEGLRAFAEKRKPDWKMR